MKIAVLSPVWFPVPPTRYGGIEWIVSLLSEGLVRAGHEVTLFASGDSSTQAELVAVYDEAPSEMIGNTQVELRQSRFQPGHISVPLGARVTWRFSDPVGHNVLFASGPSLIGTPTLSHGATHTSHFRVAGRYELFCYLHPMTMHEVVDVRAPGT